MGAVKCLGIALALFIFSNTNVEAQAQAKYRVCATMAHSSECQSLQRGNNNVTCVTVTGSIDCLVLLAEGKVDFGSFSSEETLLAAKMLNNELNVIASVRHPDKSGENFAYQSVVLVSRNYSNGLSGLSGSKLCHPGYGKAKEQMWSNHVLKYFERKVLQNSPNKLECNSDSKTSGEDEVYALSKFFSEACRPGLWLPDIEEDKKLKEKYPSLCTLCTTNRDSNCDGYKYFEPKAASGIAVNSHLSAITCMQMGQGSVAYVGYQHALEFFQESETNKNSYSIMCENGTTVPFGGKGSGSEAPCSWINQPWGTILARKDIAQSLFADMKQLIPSGQANNNALGDILFNKENLILNYDRETVSPVIYITKGRPIPNAEEKPCHKAVKWCTVNKAEQNKCLWVQAASITLGLEPEIECIERDSPLKCMSSIKSGEADFSSLDSNFGFLGRKHYNLTSAIYQEIYKENASKVYALIKEENKNEITRFENLKDKNACFPEYGGIGWVAFINAAHDRGIISRKECNYADQVVKFFRASCAPGAADPAHFPSENITSNRLCTGCKGFSPYSPTINEMGLPPPINSPQIECPADSSNLFYGNRGALFCLSNKDSHVAFLEGQNLHAHALDMKLRPEDFRILCRNGSLANRAGFDVDDDCALSVTVDSEVLRRRGYQDSLNLQLYLQDIDDWFGYDLGKRPLMDFRVFSEFNKTKNLLFKDVTIGFATKDTKNQLVENYVNLFKHTETCTEEASGGAMSMASISFVTLLMALFVHFSGNLLR